MLAGDGACGLLFSIPFHLDGLDWHNDSYKIVDCAQSRDWAPKDD